MPIKADRISRCFVCGRIINPGNEIDFIKGSRKDGTEFNAPVHTVCYDRTIPESPRPASSQGDGGPKPVVAPVPPAAAPDEPAIYTFHLRVRLQGGWMEWGVSTKGRKPKEDEIQWVDRYQKP